MSKNKGVLGLMIFSLVMIFVLATVIMYQKPNKDFAASNANSSSEKALSQKTEFFYTDITPEEAFEMIKANPEISVVDVSNNFSTGHLPGALSYPATDGSFDRHIGQSDNNKTYLIYSDADSTSTEAAQLLADAGFSKVYRLFGNFTSWQAAGLEATK
jgi:rhodanese-related sulfurtransferase